MIGHDWTKIIYFKYYKHLNESLLLLFMGKSARQGSTENFCNLLKYTANVYRDLQELCGEIRVRGFQIYGDCMLPAFPAIFLKQKQQ